MTTEFSAEQNTAAARGVSTHTSERRAHGDAERRQENHPVEVKVFGGSRSTDTRDGAAHGVGVGRTVAWLAFIALVILAWLISRGGIIEAGSGLGYYFGYVGGVMMLLMLLYPLRKHVSWARSWGPLRYWFMMHMLFGIGGPTLVLFHSTFHVKSWNAGVALYSMLLVALSGLVGRFIYKRIHLGLYGRKSNLDDMQKAVDLSQRNTDRVSAVLIAATGIDEKLKQFRDLAFLQDIKFSTRVWWFMTFDWRRYKLTRYSHHELKLAANNLAQSEGWGVQLLDQHFQDALMYVKRYLSSVQRAAQFLAYERLFRLWHILHTPFVWLLGLSGIAHVIAVNMY
ncbi:MAG: hypothetical protein WAW75_10520 [Gallionella sp.]|jgi:hypothetical protein